MRWFLSLMVAMGLSTVAHAEELGGSDVGGGGTVNVPLATMEQIEASIKDSKRALKLWLNGEEVFARENKHGSYGLSLIFALGWADPDSHQKIFEVLDDLQIEFRKTAPCVDKNGVEHDGSIYTSIPGGKAICISGLRLSQKLRQDDYDFQTAALILHEASHLMGADEKEAQQVQAAAVIGLRAINFKDSVDIILQIIWNYHGLTKEIDRIVQMASGETDLHDSELNGAINAFDNQFMMAQKYLNKGWNDPEQYNKPFITPLGLFDIDRTWNMQVEIHNLTHASCDHFKYEQPCEKYYENTFNGASFMYAKAYYYTASHEASPAAAAWPTQGQFIDEKIPHITTLDQFRDALAHLRDEVKMVAASLDKLYYEKPFVVQTK